MSAVMSHEPQPWDPPNASDTPGIMKPTLFFPFPFFFFFFFIYSSPTAQSARCHEHYEPRVNVNCTSCTTNPNVFAPLHCPVGLQSCAATKGDNETRVCVFFFFFLQSHSLTPRASFPPFFLLFLTLHFTKTQQPDPADRQLKRAAFVEWNKNTHTHEHTDTHTDTETHTHLPQSRARRDFSNWTCSIFNKKKRGENVSAALRITSRGLRCVRRAALVKCSAHTHTLTLTHTHTCTHRKCKCGMGGTARSDVTPGLLLLLLLLLHVRSGGLLELRAGRVDGTRARTQMTSTRFFFFFFFK